MSNLLSSVALNPATRRVVANYLEAPAHALLILGPAGSGKSQLAKIVAASLLGLDSVEKLNSHPFFRRLSKPEDKQAIPIEDVRTALAQTKLKNVGLNSRTSRVIFIENAAFLGHDAQNVLLKDLEEPNPGLVFIITANAAQNLLPTIVSRCQKIKCSPITLNEALAYFNDYDESAVRTAWALAGGAPGLVSELLSQGNEHPLKAAVSQVKDLMAKPEYEQLVELDKAAQDKQKLAELLIAQEKVWEALHHVAIAQGNTAQSISLLRKRKKIQRLQAQLAANANPRLVATELAMEV